MFKMLKSSQIITTFRIRFFRIEITMNESLTHWMPELPSYRNHSIDLLCKSIYCFLYGGNTGI